MKEEMAFLKYRREVVLAWPESPRKGVFLAGIESRLASERQRLHLVSAGTPRFTDRSSQIETESV
jgi:hypothetical protein